ncbi:MAG: hypothetical protein JXB48_10960 [Candidatus Latescibacteria bacterium]|nr:hypothetical protein [Candidatus Latescibacterota bacterium]
MKIDAIFTGLYKTFKDNENRIVFAVVGRRGTGKSSIAKYLADRFKESGVTLRVFHTEENSIWSEEDSFAVAHRDGSVDMKGEVSFSSLMPVMNIFDELFECFEDIREEYTDRNRESEVIITSDVNGFLSHLKNNKEENQKLLVLMPIGEYVCFKPLIANYMHVISVNHSKQYVS